MQLGNRLFRFVGLLLGRAENGAKDKRVAYASALATRAMEGKGGGWGWGSTEKATK